jgi:hypothetical protein
MERSESTLPGKNALGEHFVQEREDTIILEVGARDFSLASGSWI